MSTKPTITRLPLAADRRADAGTGAPDPADRTRPQSPDAAKGAGRGPRPGTQPPGEVGGPQGPEPTRYGDWEVGGRCSDF